MEKIIHKFRIKDIATRGIIKYINTKSSINDLVKVFLKKGGRVDKYYLFEWNRNKHAIVFLNGWFSGKNIREALTKALS